MPKKKKDVDNFKQEVTIDDHIISLTALSNRYGTDLEYGLNLEFAAKLLKDNGPNSLASPPSKPRIIIFLETMFGGFALLLWVGAIMSIIGHIVSVTADPNAPYDNIYIASTLLVVIIITGVFSYVQEASNVSVMEGFLKLVPKNATVIREGINIILPSENIVIGDIVKVQGGDCVPADIRILESSGLKVDNSSITGESDPQLRSTENTNLNPLETANLAFYGTNVIEGSGKGIVIATGKNTLMGHIAQLTSGLPPTETPMKNELKLFIKIICVIAFLVGLIFFLLVVGIYKDIFRAFIYFIAIVVANVPEGLLVTMTACLTLTGKRMAKKNCLVKNLQAIETLGCTNVIVSDKTGTLTQNKMTVAHMFYDLKVYEALPGADNVNQGITFGRLCRIGILCSRAEFEKNDIEVNPQFRTVFGDASETAVLKCMERYVGNTTAYRLERPKVFEIPFNSANKFQLSIHKMPDSKKLVLVMKGAPERILDRCSKILIYGVNRDFDDEFRHHLKNALLELGFLGERVLGFADLDLPQEFDERYPFDSDKMNFPTVGMRFVGFMSLIDPPKIGVLDAVLKCKSAGIRVIMATGDHPITAMAIARKVGIISPESLTVYDLAMKRNVSASKITEEEASACNAVIVTGTDLREMDDRDLESIISRYQEIVFARTSPQQKLLIVESFQRLGNIVAVTGDGVNDSPALKKADIGIAMGISGSDVSKEAADMIILDDNFATIITGIEEGRLIFDNLKKSIAYMLTSNIPEVIPLVLHAVLKIPNALHVMAILLIDVGTDLWPGISLAYELPESDIMKRPPRDTKSEKLVGAKLLCFTSLNVGVTQACAALSCYFYIMAEHGFLPSRLIGISDEWYSSHDAVLDSYNQEWTYRERQRLERMSVATFFMAIVVTQVADIIICKTRRLSIIQHGMGNNVMNFAICFEIFVSFLAVYCPYIHDVLLLEPFHLYLLWPALPFSLIIIVQDEARRFFIRRNPNGWLKKETYF